VQVARSAFVVSVVVGLEAVVVVTVDVLFLEVGAADIAVVMKEPAALVVKRAVGFGSRKTLRGPKLVLVEVERV
jgi:hypothetical protein